MRIPIREQLALLILLASLIGLGVISVATWVSTNQFVLTLRANRLLSYASLKASQVSTNLLLLQNSVQFVSSRIVIQQALANYNENNDNSEENFATATIDMLSAIGGPASGGAFGIDLLLQSQIFPRTNTGPAGYSSLINTTNPNVLGKIRLPFDHPNGSAVYLGDQDLGYPSELYPTFTYYDIETENNEKVAVANFNGLELSPIRQKALLLGPMVINSTYSILSITIPIINNTSSLDVVGWLTVVMDAQIVTNVQNVPEGLGLTGEMLIVRPTNVTNRFPADVTLDDGPVNLTKAEDEPVKFILPLIANDTSRHRDRVYGTSNPPFNISQYPIIIKAVTTMTGDTNNGGSELKTINENGLKVSTGFALVAAELVDWIVLVELSRKEVWQPIHNLRTILVVCVFATAACMMIIAWPLAHIASKPIRELRSATLKSVMPPGYDGSDESSTHDFSDDDNDDADNSPDMVMAKKEGFIRSLLSKRRLASRRRITQTSEDVRRRKFKIPGKVKIRKHFVNDELTELTTIFNEMTDELMMQYERLEERVQQRTAELELSKKAAEAANESKTLFIANISHELKTPLNGILGMCAVCMQEDDPIRLKRSLSIIYKSGDLLLNLLTDLLTFSKNQVGQQLTLDEKDFHLRDISSQIIAIFNKQAKDSQINLNIQFQSSALDIIDDDHANRVKDMILWGDIHRILQVIINLVSNSLKFTPPNGKVTLTLRCLGEVDPIIISTTNNNSRKASLVSKLSKNNKSNKNRHSELSFTPGLNRSSVSTDNGSAIIDKGAFQRITEIERLPPPPGKTMMFEFEVTDTGPGIPQESHQKIFEPFVQGDLGLSKKYGGTGLGLSICNQLAGLMGGNMTIKSEIGSGSTFTLRIPLRHLLSRPDSSASSRVSLFDTNNNNVHHTEDTNNNSISPTKRRSLHIDNNNINLSTTSLKSSPIELSPSLSSSTTNTKPRLVGLSQPFFTTDNTDLLFDNDKDNKIKSKISEVKKSIKNEKIKVLVAEDNKVNQEVVLRMLRLEDIYDVTVAKDGQEAFDLVKASMLPDCVTGPFNLIFMDVQMPNVDGLQSTKLIRECGFTSPIVALTAFAEESNVKDCLDSGMNYFLSKPIRRPALKKVLNEYCAPIVEVDEDNILTPVIIEKEADNYISKGLSIIASSDEGIINNIGDVIVDEKGNPIENERPKVPITTTSTVVITPPSSTNGEFPKSTI